MSDGLRMGQEHRVTALNLDHGRPCAFGHGPLSVRRDHLVFGSDEEPAWLCSPCRLGDGTAERLDTPRDLGVGHARSHVRIHVRGEEGGKLGLIEEYVSILRWQDRWRGRARGCTLNERRCRFALVRCECRDVDQTSDLWIVARFGDHYSAV